VSVRRSTLYAGLTISLASFAFSFGSWTAQRSMAQRAHATVVETAASHAVYVSKPEVVAALIEQAATSSSAVAK